MLRLSFLLMVLFALPVLAQNTATPSPTATATPMSAMPPKPALPAPTEAQRAAALKITEQDHVLGKADAPVTIIEYASLSCSHCAAAHHTTVAPLIKKYVESGKVKFVFRDFPLNAPAMRGGMLAHCAGKDQYYTFLKVLFEQQSQWAFHQNYLEMLEKIAKLGGMTTEKFKACMNDKTLEDRLIMTKKQAIEGLAIQSTPTFFINGTPLQGNRSLEEISGLVDALLKK
jgi:protein-disulfide isomerase